MARVVPLVPSAWLAAPVVSPEEPPSVEDSAWAAWLPVLPWSLRYRLRDPASLEIRRELLQAVVSLAASRMALKVPRPVARGLAVPSWVAPSSALPWTVRRVVSPPACLQPWAPQVASRVAAVVSAAAARAPLPMALPRAR